MYLYFSKWYSLQKTYFRMQSLSVYERMKVHMASLMERTYNKNQFARWNFPLNCFYFEIEMFAEKNGRERALHSIFS